MQLVLYRPAERFAWELRTALASRRRVRLLLSERCDNVRLNKDGLRVLGGRVTGVAATGAYVIIQRRHVPLGEILAILSAHYTQTQASDPIEMEATE